MSHISDSTTLNARIRELVIDDPDPSVITAEILAGIDDAEARVIAEVTLREHVRRIITTLASHSAADTPPSEAPQAPPLTPRRSGHDARNPLITQVRDHRAVVILMEPLKTERRWKRHGEATPADLSYAAHSRFDIAEATRIEGTRYQRAHDELVQQGLSRLEELSDEVIIDIFQH